MRGKVSMATSHFPVNAIGNNSVEVVIMPSRAEAENLDTSLGKPLLTSVEEKDYEIASELISADRSLDSLKLRHCQAYLKKHGLRVSDKKDTLINRIREHLELKDGGGEVKYPLSTFSVDCQGDICIGDVVLFTQRIFEEKFDKCLRKIYPPLGDRIVAGRIVNDIYAVMRHQRTITVEVLWSTGAMPFPPLQNLRLKGNDFCALKILRQLWVDEAKREKVFLERRASDPHQSQGFNYPSEKKRASATEKSARNTMQAQDIHENSGELQCLQKQETNENIPKSLHSLSAASEEPRRVSVCMAKDNRSLQESHSCGPPNQSTCLLRKERSSHFSSLSTAQLFGEQSDINSCKSKAPDLYMYDLDGAGSLCQMDNVTSDKRKQAVKVVCCDYNQEVADQSFSVEAPRRQVLDTNNRIIATVDKALSMDCSITCDDASGVGNSAGKHVCDGCSGGKVPSDWEVHGMRYTGMHKRTFFPQDVKYALPLKTPANVHLQVPDKQPLGSGSHGILKEETFEVVGSIEIKNVTPISDNIQVQIVDDDVKGAILNSVQGPLQKKHVISDFELPNKVSTLGSPEVVHQPSSCNTSHESYCCKHAPRIQGSKDSENYQSILKAGQESLGAADHHPRGATISCSQPGNQSARKKKINPELDMQSKFPEAGKVLNDIEGHQMLECRKRECAPNDTTYEKRMLSRKDKTVNEEEICKLKLMHVKESTHNSEFLGVVSSKHKKEENKFKQPTWVKLLKRQGDEADQLLHNYLEHAKVSEDFDKAGILEALIYAKKKIKRLSERCKSQESPSSTKEEHCSEGTSLSCKKVDFKAKAGSNPKVDVVKCENRGGRWLETSVKYEGKTKNAKSSQSARNLTGVRKQHNEIQKMTPSSLDVNDNQYRGTESPVLADDYRTQVHFCTKGETGNPGEEFMSTTHVILGKKKKKHMHSKASSMSVSYNTGQQKEQKHSSSMRIPLETAKSSKKAEVKSKRSRTIESEEENQQGSQVMNYRKREKTVQKRNFCEPDVPILLHKKKKKKPNHSPACECNLRGLVALKSKRKHFEEMADLADERLVGNKNESQPKAEKQIENALLCTIKNDISVLITSGKGQKKKLPQSTQLFCRCGNFRPKNCQNNVCKICCRKTDKKCKLHKKAFC